MIKYITTAVALKCFSSTPATRSLYRSLGNRVGNQRRGAGKIPSYYVDRLKRMLRLNKQFNLVKDGDHILELGTGWLHWEALTLRLFYDIKATLYDVWDNRQLGGLKNNIGQLRPMLADFGLTPAELKRSQSIIDAILKVNTFDELYQLMDFEYVVHPTGSLEMFKDNSYQLVVSGGVLEHVYRDAIPLLIKETRRILKPGAWAVHSIDTADHLEHYDPSVSAKKYLTYSEATWKWFFQNDLQYINRLQRGEWLKLFRDGGFELVEEEARRVDISKLKIAPRFAGMEKGDLECTVLRLTMKKPQ